MAHANVQLCICSSFPGRANDIAEQVEGNLFDCVYVCCKDPATDFAAAKESGRPIVLVVAGALGHDAIAYLCDDYYKKPEDRRVQWIHSIPAGIDFYRLEALQKEIAGIPFTNGRGGYSEVLAMHTVYSILYFNRQTSRLLRNKQERRWEPFDVTDPRCEKVGIIGYGSIGQATARMLKAMGLEVTGVKRNPGPEVDEFGVRIVCGKERNRVICESDYIVNALPATEETRGMFNMEIFKMMKPTAFYINVGRGETQNEVDLAKALKSEVIAGASLDVFEVEPLPSNSPLWDIPDEQLLITSHNAGISKMSFADTVSIFIENAKEFLRAGNITAFRPDTTAGY